MCGRFSLTGSLIWLIRLLNLQAPEKFAPRYNIAPGQPVLVFLHDPDSRTNKYDFQVWGLIPSFVKDLKEFKGLINARAETISEKPSFKKAFQYRRCIIPASGFYEWQNTGGVKQPWYFSSKNADEYFYFAGLWDIWHGPDGEQVNSCAIITTVANRLARKVHHRMPVILEKESLRAWLDPESETSELQNLLKPCSENFMQSWIVDRKVNSPAFDSPDCIAPAGEFQPDLF